MSEATITIDALTKRFGRGTSAVTAVQDLTFEVPPGRVTAFLGPNGAGKTTTLRCLLGLVRPTAGAALFGGKPYRDLDNPAQRVGASLEASGFYPGRRAVDHVASVADAAGIGPDRVSQVLAQVGLAGAERRRVGEYSLGMRQRLTLAVALLGEPQYLILDEPANGLDPQGIAWLRGFLRYLADAGRTVLISSHVLAEVEQIADDVVIIDRGKLVAAAPLKQLRTASAGALVEVLAPEAERLAAEVVAQIPQAFVTRDGQRLQVRGASAALIGGIAFRAGVELHGLTERGADLEQLFLELTVGQDAS